MTTSYTLYSTVNDQQKLVGDSYKSAGYYGKVVGPHTIVMSSNKFIGK